jgi:D-tyrosyl-tRNA(Tyr) deacylase
VRAVVQRVGRAEVRVDGVTVGAIGPGLCVLVGVGHDDDGASARRMAERIWHLRIFADDRGHMNLPVAHVGGQVLVVSQFSLYAETSRGRRPSFVAAARPEHAAPLVQQLVGHLVALGATVATGVFGADMAVELVNDGPLTVQLEVSAP